MSMYLSQAVAIHSGKGCAGGAPEPDVIRTLMDTGMSEGVAQFHIDFAVRDGWLVRLRCACGN